MSSITKNDGCHIRFLNTENDLFFFCCAIHRLSSASSFLLLLLDLKSLVCFTLCIHCVLWTDRAISFRFHTWYNIRFCFWFSSLSNQCVHVGLFRAVLQEQKKRRFNEKENLYRTSKKRGKTLFVA